MKLKFNVTKLLILLFFGLSISGLTPLVAAAPGGNSATVVKHSDEDDEDMYGEDEDDEDYDDEDGDYDDEDDEDDEDTAFYERLSKANTMKDIYKVGFEDLEPSELKSMLAYTEKNFPGYLKSLEKHFLKDDPSTIVDSLSDVEELMGEKAEAGDNKAAQEEYKTWLAIEQLEVKSLMISWDIKAAKAQKEKSVVVAKLKKELTKVLDETFKLKMAEQKKEVEEVEKEVKAMKAKIAMREKSRAEIIQKRIKELTEPEDETQW